jgi:hypothetical protein
MTKPPNKFLLALQFWEGDREKAMQTARLIADLQHRRDDRFDFLFSARFDCPHDTKTVEYVSSKFAVHTFINKNRRGEGWPHGPNELWFGTVDHVYNFSHAKRLPPYRAILTFEADAYPLEPNWLSALAAEWDKVESKGVKMLGALQQYPAEHINGNCFVSGELAYLHWITREISGCKPSGGWDYVLRDQFKRRGWQDCPLMKSHWGAKTTTPEFLNRLSQEGAVFLHGVKDESVVNYMRNRFLRSSPPLVGVSS